MCWMQIALSHMRLSTRRRQCLAPERGVAKIIRTFMKSILILVLLIACGGCGAKLAPSSSIVGDWSGRVAPLHFAHLSIRFIQQGSEITGIACYQDPEGAADGKGILFRDAPVSVDYPNVSLSVGSPASFSFSGRFQPNGELKGSSGNGNSRGSGYPMTLGRGGNYCGL